MATVPHSTCGFVIDSLAENRCALRRDNARMLCCTVQERKTRCNRRRRSEYQNKAPRTAARVVHGLFEQEGMRPDWDEWRRRRRVAA